MSDRTCGEIMDPFLRELATRTDLPTVQIIGGNGSAALLHDDTVIDTDARTIEASAACDLPRYRPDGSLRDLDALVLTSDEAQIDRVRTIAEELIGSDLKTSIFGLKTLAALERQQRHPVRSTARVFLGDRYVTTSYDDDGSLATADGYKALYPFRARTTAETLETFMLSAGGRLIPTTHPGATILNYLTRSISGLRAKDTEKLGRMTQQVLSRRPEIADWIHDGPGRETLELARVLHTLRVAGRGAETLQLGERLRIVPYRLSDLVDHEGFMASHLGSRSQRAVLDAAHAKSVVLGTFEARSGVVTFWQKHVEDRLRRVIYNED